MTKTELVQWLWIWTQRRYGSHLANEIKPMLGQLRRLTLRDMWEDLYPQDYLPLEEQRCYRIDRMVERVRSTHEERPDRKKDPRDARERQANDDTRM